MFPVGLSKGQSFLLVPEQVIYLLGTFLDTVYQEAAYSVFDLESDPDDLASHHGSPLPQGFTYREAESLSEGFLEHDVAEALEGAYQVHQVRDDVHVS